MSVETLIFIVLVVGAVAGGVFFYSRRSSDDEKRITPQAQEGSYRPSVQAKPNTVKTAQLSALRERLAEAQGGPAATPGTVRIVKKVVKVVKKIPATQKSPLTPESGSNISPAQSSDSASIPNKSPEPSESSWNPADAGLDSGKPFMVSDIRVEVPVSHEEEIFNAPQLPQSNQPNQTASNPVVDSAISNKTTAVYTNDSTPTPVNHSRKKAHILLVDDSKVVRVKTEKLLVAEGYEVSTAIDGIDALTKLESISPDVIITDIEMPNLDGFGLVRNVKNNSRTADIPVIVMTSHVNLHLDIAATEGINGFLPKPFNDQELLEQVSYLVNS